jgi:hypothetical protein
MALTFAFIGIMEPTIYFHITEPNSLFNTIIVEGLFILLPGIQLVLLDG